MRPRLEAHPQAHSVPGWPLVELGAESRPAEPPADFYLWELLDLDLHSAEEVVEFIRRWGPSSAVLLRAAPPWESRDGQGDAPDNATAIWAAGDSVYSWREEHAACEDEATTNVTEFRLSAAIMRDVVRTFLLAEEVLDFDCVCASWECSRVTPPDEQAALAWASERLSWGLSAFRPTVRLLPLERRRQRAGDPVFDTDVIGVCCLQLFNDIVAGHRYWTCARCGRVFVRQRGRAAKRNGDGTDSARNGARAPRPARYCSTKCASAASSEMHRERRRSLTA